MANFLGLTGLTTQKQEIVKKWYDSGLLDSLGIDSTTTKVNLASLLESQASQLINETNQTTTSSFENVVFPIIRRVNARTLFQDIEPYYIESKKDGLTPYNYVKKHKL